MNPLDDELLVAAKHDGDAFADFYRRYEGAVLAYFMRRTRQPDRSRRPSSSSRRACEFIRRILFDAFMWKLL